MRANEFTHGIRKRRRRHKEELIVKLILLSGPVNLPRSTNYVLHKDRSISPLLFEERRKDFSPADSSRRRIRSAGCWCRWPPAPRRRAKGKKEKGEGHCRRPAGSEKGPPKKPRLGEDSLHPPNFLIRRRIVTKGNALSSYRGI